MANFKHGDTFPSLADQNRILRYKRNKELFKGKHFEILTRLNSGDYKDLLYISMNVVGIICKKSADFMFGDGVRVLSATTEGQDRFNAFIKDNQMNIVNYESALANSYKGDIFYKIRYGQEYGGLVDSTLDPSKVRISLQNPEYVFPEVNPMDAKQIVAYHIVTPEKITEYTYILHVETHSPARILYRMFNAQPLEFYPDHSVKVWKIGAEAGAPVEEYTGVAHPLVIHVPNFGTDDTWEGLDDISEFIPMIDEINNRLTQIASILDKHADPALAVPTGTLGEDEAGNPVFNVAYNKVFETDSKDDFIPQYVVWNGQLEAAFTELELLLDNLYTLAEIPPVALGKDGSGTSGSSGQSIKFRLNSMLAKTNRKRMYYEKALQRVFMIAQQLESSLGGVKYTPEEPILKFRDGLPADYSSDAIVMQTRTNSSVTMSVKTALMTFDGYTEKQADAEIKRIEEEKKKNMEMFGGEDKGAVDNRFKQNDPKAPAKKDDEPVEKEEKETEK